MPRKAVEDFAASGFGPDKLPYSEALAQAWANSPSLPSNISVKPGRATGKSRGRVSRASQRGYDGPLRRLQAPTKEGIRMARASRAAATAEPEIEETESTFDPAVYADKPVTPAAQAFAEWLYDQTGHGGEPGTEEHEAHARSVYMAMGLRRKFQADEDTRTRIAEIREERAEALKEAKAAKAAASVPAEGEEGEEGEAPAKPKRTRASKASTPASTGAATKPAAAKPAGGTTGRRGAAVPRTRRGAATAKPGDAPF